MTTYIFTTQARLDLNNIIEYIAGNNPDAAFRFVREIDRKCETLANFPMMGRSYSEIFPRLRGFPLDKYIILYRPIDNGIEVVRVISGYRNLETLLLEEDWDEDNGI